MLRKLFSRQLRHLTAIPVGAAGGKERLDRRMEFGVLEVGGVFGQVRHGISPRTTGQIHSRVGTGVVGLGDNSMHIFIRVESVAKSEGMSST